MKLSAKSARGAAENSPIREQKPESATVSAIRALIHASQRLERASAVMLNRSQVLAAKSRSVECCSSVSASRAL